MIDDPVFSVTETGISAPSYEEIYEYLKGRMRAIFGDDINLDADTQDGQMVGIVAAAISDVNAQAIAVYNAYNPTTAKGVALDSAVKVNGITRQAASHSQVDLRIVGQAGTHIVNGVALDEAENKWNLPADVVVPPAGEITVTAIAAEEGNIQAPAGTVNRIGTPTLGWQTVENILAAEPGAPVQTDLELRVQQSKSTALPSVSLWEGVIGSLLTTAGVRRVSGIKNDGDTPTTEGVPGHSIAMIVDGAWDFATFEQAGMNWDFAPMPKLGDDYTQYAQGSASPAWAIYAKLEGDKLKAAEKFLTFLSSKWALQKHNDAGDAVTVDGFDATVMTQYQKVYDQDIKTGKYYLHTNFYSKPDILKSELKAQNQQLVQGQITPDQYAKNIDAKVAAAQ